MSLTDDLRGDDDGIRGLPGVCKGRFSKKLASLSMERLRFVRSDFTGLKLPGVLTFACSPEGAREVLDEEESCLRLESKLIDCILGGSQKEPLEPIDLWFTLPELARLLLIDKSDIT